MPGSCRKYNTFCWYKNACRALLIKIASGISNYRSWAQVNPIASLCIACALRMALIILIIENNQKKKRILRYVKLYESSFQSPQVKLYWYLNTHLVMCKLSEMPIQLQKNHGSSRDPEAENIYYLAFDRNSLSASDNLKICQT